MNKKILKSADFLIIIVLICIPPIFAAPATPLTAIDLYTFSQAHLLALLQITVLLVLSRYKAALFHAPSIPPQYMRIHSKDILRHRIQWTVISLVLLTASTGLIYLAATGGSGKICLMPPTANIMKLLTVILPSVLLFAAREEVLYRLYLINAALYAKIPVNVTVALSIALFAAAHFPAGVASVVNATAGGVILTFCRYKTDSVLCPLIIHILYNIAVLFIA